MKGLRTLAAVAVLGLPVSASAADLPTRTAAWLRTLGIPAPANPRIVVIGEGWSAEGMSLTPDVIGVKRSNLDAMLDGGRGEFLLHELLHLAGSDDEGLVEAVTLDLLPAWEHRFPMRGSIRVRLGGVYTDEVHAVRRESARACGCPWSSRDARLWRRARIVRYGSP